MNCQWSGHQDRHKDTNKKLETKGPSAVCRWFAKSRIPEIADALNVPRRITIRSSRDYIWRPPVVRWAVTLTGSAIDSPCSYSYISADCNLYRGNPKAPRSNRKFPTEPANKSSEEWNETSEERFRSSEEFFYSSLEIQRSPPKNCSISLIVCCEWTHPAWCVSPTPNEDRWLRLKKE